MSDMLDKKYVLSFFFKKLLSSLSLWSFPFLFSSSRYAFAEAQRLFSLWLIGHPQSFTFQYIAAIDQCHIIEIESTCSNP